MTCGAADPSVEVSRYALRRNRPTLWAIRALRAGFHDTRDRLLGLSRQDGQTVESVSTRSSPRFSDQTIAVSNINQSL